MPTIGTDIEEAASRLRAGRLSAFATETVYGLGAKADDKTAMSQLYALKKRPLGHPCIIHLSDFSEAEKWAHIPPPARQLAEAFMPGALTLLLPSRTNGTIALRVPGHKQARELLSRAGVGIAAPSANCFGGISPTLAAHVMSEFPDIEDLYILDGGQCEFGVESTIAACLDGRLSILRPGAILSSDIASAAGMELSPPPQVASPGNLRTHYSPKTKLLLTSAEEVLNANKNAAVLSRHCPQSLPTKHWRQMPESPQQCARCLYAFLRELDAIQASVIIVETPPDTPEWSAVRDRLTRAAGDG